MLARIENSVVAEFRDITMEAVPEHKRSLWLPVVYEGDGPLSETIVEADKVRIVQSTPPPAPLTQTDYAAAIENHIDHIARAKAYSGAVSLASYADSSFPTWKAEAETFIAWRDAVWLYAYTQLAAVQSEQRTAPPIADLISELPRIEWPE